MIAAGKRPVPFRTRKLSPPAPMVLPPGGGGRVGYRRPNNFTPTPATHQPRCAAGVFASPLPQQPANITPPHCGHCRHLHTPQRGLLGVQGSSAPLRTTPVPPCGHRDSALQTPQVTTDSAMQSSRRVSRFSLIADSASLHCGQRRYLHTPQRGLLGVQDGPARLRTPRLRIVDTAGIYALRNASISTGGKACDRVADSASLHCGHGRYLLTAQRG